MDEKNHPTKGVNADQPADTASGAPIYLFNSNALLAEDTAMQIRNAGHRVVVIRDAGMLAEAVAIAEPAALIADCDFRDSALTQIARIAQGRQAGSQGFPIACISGRGGFEARLAAARAGADCHFTRPVDVTALIERLHALLPAPKTDSYRILIVGDNPATTADYARTLSGAGMGVASVEKIPDIFRMLDDYRPELVLIDVNIAGCSGLELTRLIRMSPGYLDIPIVVLADGRRTAAFPGIIGAGADDVLGKPVTAAGLASSVAHRAARHRTLRGLIMRDSLTGLYNHAAIKEYLAREISVGNRIHQPVALAMIDIDFFKRVNDTHGHPVGDQVIRALSRLLQRRLRHGDVIGRYGGEEFAVVLPNTSAAAALRVLDEVREAFAAIRHYADDAEFHATFSGGIAVASEPACSVESLFSQADAALYDAKHKGRNRIEPA